MLHSGDTHHQQPATPPGLDDVSISLPHMVSKDRVNRLNSLWIPLLGYHSLENRSHKGRALGEHSPCGEQEGRPGGSRLIPLCSHTLPRPEPGTPATSEPSSSIFWELCRSSPRSPRPRVEARMSRCNPVVRILQSQTRARSSGLSSEQIGCKEQGSQTWGPPTGLLTSLGLFVLTEESFCASLVGSTFSPHVCEVLGCVVLEGIWWKAYLCLHGILDVLVDRRTQIKQPASQPGLQ